MNIIKNMEAVFVAAAFLATVATYSTASTPVIEVAAASAPQAAHIAAADSKMQVITVSAKRLSAAEKAALI